MSDIRTTDLPIASEVASEDTMLANVGEVPVTSQVPLATLGAAISAIGVMVWSNANSRYETRSGGITRPGNWVVRFIGPTDPGVLAQDLDEWIDMEVPGEPGVIPAIFDDAVAFWTARDYDNLNARLTDLSGNGHHAVPGSANGGDQPVALPHSGAHYVYLPGTVDNSVSTPNTTGGTAYYTITRTSAVTEDGDTVADPIVIGGTAHSGSIARVQVYSDSGRTALVADLDPSTSVEPHNSITGALSEVWTVNRRSTPGRKTVLVDRPIVLFGHNSLATVTSHSALNFGIGSPFTFLFVYRQHHAEDYGGPMSKRLSGVNTNAGWTFLQPNNFRMAVEYRGGGVSSDIAAQEVHIVPGETTRVAFTRDGTTHVLHNNAYTRSLTMAEIDLTNAEPLLLGKGQTATLGTFPMEFLGAAVFPRALSAVEIAEAATWLS